MTFKAAYKVTAVLAALATFGALNAQAQTTPQTTPQTTDSTPPATTAQPDASTGQPDAAAAAQTSPAADASNPAKDFIRQTFLANEFGIAAAQVAIAKAQSPETKAAAQTVLNDGMKVRQDMITAIQGSTSDMHFDQTWNADYKAKLADLQTAADADFDQKYAAIAGQVLTSAASTASAYAASGDDAAVKTFATTAQPIFQSDAGKLAATASS
ncbi:MAG: DUF4142 domain-containing protein [Asticcacaulis sp.]|uniref:DUF4142 domain-containing protein n=1 Tax=Asticcacaulis sp. TaxID=1872648 RepID=UPI003F7C6F25